MSHGCHTLTASKWRTVRILSILADEVDNSFEEAGYSSRTSFIEDSVRRRLEELRKHVKSKVKISEQEKLQLTEAANEITRSLGCLEEEKVRDYLEDTYHWWPKPKIERGVQFICSLKIKN